MDAQAGQRPSAQEEMETLEAAATSGGGIFKKRAKFGSAQKNIRKPISVPQPSSKNGVSDDESDDGESDSEEHTRPSGIMAGRKRKRGGLIQAASSRNVAANADEVVTYSPTNPGARLDPKTQATATSAEFSEAELHGRSNSTTAAAGSDNVYRGQKGYRSLLPQREQITTKYNPVGPQKAASNVRMTTVVDYAPGAFCPLISWLENVY